MQTDTLQSQSQTSQPHSLIASDRVEGTPVRRTDGEKIGTTPCEVKYLWYGTRELVVELSGYRLVSELVTLSPPWWQIMPLDFVTDVLLPFTITDRVDLVHTLEPAPVSKEEVQEVLRRAEELRRRAAAKSP